MFGTILCVATLALGVETGWEPNDAGGLDYIIQIDSTQLKHLKEGIPYQSDLPKNLRGLQTIRFQVGDKKLPRIALAPEKKTLPDPPAVVEFPGNKLPSNSTTSESPKKLADNPATKPIPHVAKAVFDEPLDSKSPAKEGMPKDETSKKTDPEKPWSLLYGVIALAVGFAAAFTYLSWIHIGMRSRYRHLLAEHIALTQPT
ncbi:MAG: hypothetical protein JXM70_29470 [Pirellulales bacterium]|nr:hypothetical protein [Pirellulales bacterium]